MIDLMLAAFLGFAAGVIWQEIHFQQITAQLFDLERQFDDLEARIVMQQSSPGETEEVG